MAGFSLYTLSAVRSYVAGESLWSKGQKDAIYYLTLYADSANPDQYAAYERAIAVPKGGHLLRIALDKPQANIEAATTGILNGGNDPADVDGIIWFFLHFRHFSYLEQAIEQWKVGDSYLLQLSNLAHEIHDGVTNNRATPNDTRRWKNQIAAINAGVTPAAKAFSDALGAGSRAILRLLLIANLATALCLISLALLRTHMLLSQRRAFANALREEKERAQVTLESFGDAVVTTDVDGLIVYMNPAAEELTLCKFHRAYGMPLSGLFVLLDEAGQPLENSHSLIGNILSGRLGNGAEHLHSIKRLDDSKVPVSLVGSPILSAGRVSGTVLVLHDMTRERQYIAKLSWQATHDELTGLANRREFEARLEQVLRQATRQVACHTLMYLDLDQFKLVNDTCGHAAGDELLRHISAVLQQGLRAQDTLCRLGGDEFGILLQNCPPDKAEQIADSLRTMVHNLHFIWQERSFVNTVSIGLVHLDHVPITLETALRAADMACYMAKEKGRNRAHVYHAEDADLAIRYSEMAWVQRLHQAMEENRFCLYAQEIAPFDAAAVTSRHVEILLRLHDEDGHLVMPDNFIPAAERYGLMSVLDRWVVEKVFATIADCLAQGHAGPIAMCAINLSGSTIGDDEFLEFLRQQFLSHGIAPELICFEITETVAISNLGSAIRFINELKDLGCRFSLDDFCAGMSSFAYLKHLPVDYLKIDGSFVQDMLDNPVNHAMVEVINHIGHVMGKKTIAEFVETPQIRDALLEIGIDYAQGFLIGRPEIFTCESLHPRASHSHVPGKRVELSRTER